LCARYGLGSIYHRQEKHELAEYHFRRAVEVNNVSSVLKCFLAMVLHAQGNEEKTREALSLLAEASEADPKNPQLHFQKAHILYATAMAEGASTENSGNTLYPVETFLGMTTLELLEEGLKSLELVRVLAPREPPVYAMLGQVN
jgi:tetratricopeptide (TPR) repeat protein